MAVRRRKTVRKAKKVRSFFRRGVRNRGGSRA